MSIKNKGFTLIEVLITIVIMGVGLLGLAGLQVTALRNNVSAEHRSQASQLVYDLSDRMRTNTLDSSLGAASVYVTQDPAAAAAVASCLQIAGRCGPTQLATHDIFEWNQAIETVLPSGQGTVTFLAPIFTISVSWDDDRNGAVDANDPSLQMRFQL